MPFLNHKHKIEKMLQYVVTNLDARDTLGIDNNEAFYLFAVHFFERDRDGGFCTVYGSTMARIVGVNEKSIRNIKKRMEKRGFITVRKTDGAARVTDSYRDVCNASKIHLSEYFKAKPGQDTEEMPGGIGAEKFTAPPPVKITAPPGKNYLPPPVKITAPPRQNLPGVIKSTVIKEDNSFYNEVSTAHTHTTEKNNFEIFENGAGNEGKKVSSSVCLFRECNYFKGGAAGREKFEADLKAAGCPGEVDFDYYFNRLQAWSDKNGAKSKDWGKTALKFVQDDAQQGHMATVQFMPIDQQPQQAQPQHATHSRRNGSSRKNAISHAQVLADVERIIADGW